jgi:hypothetical protein
MANCMEELRMCAEVQSGDQSPHAHADNTDAVQDHIAVVWYSWCLALVCEMAWWWWWVVVVRAEAARRHAGADAQPPAMV